MSLTVEALAQEIHDLDVQIGNQTPRERAESLLPFIERHIAAGKQGAGDGVPAALTGKYGEVLRPFLAMMEHELHANAGKGDRPGWLTMSSETAMLEIYYHVAKLQKAVRNGHVPSIGEYSADVANMAMMVADIFCALITPDSATPLPQQSAAEGAPYDSILPRDRPFEEGGCLRQLSRAIQERGALPAPAPQQMTTQGEAVAPFGWWLEDCNGIGRFVRNPTPEYLDSHRTTPGYSATALHTGPQP